MSHDSWEPKLRVPASGLGGSGYKIPTRLDERGKPVVLPGVTTVLGALEKPGVTAWAVDNTAAYAAVNVDALLNRSEEQAFGFLRFYTKRFKEKDFDDPTIDIRDYSNGVLDDLAELGTMTHDWVADFVNDYFPEELVRPEQEEMAAEFVDWYNQHDVTVLGSELTVVGDAWAGTLDHLWIVDGVPTLVDVKTSRKTRETHFAQLAALGSAEAIMREVDADTEGAVEYETKKWGKTYWIEEPMQGFSQYAILHLRPTDDDKPAFCEFKVIPQEIIDTSYELFRGALTARHGQRKLKDAMKAIGWED